jgi:hypothetical protein
MTKEQALHRFWSEFGVTAYDENTVPDDAQLPYITYEVATDSIGNDVSASVSIWDRGTSWTTVTNILDDIASTIGRGGTTRRYDNGLLWVKKGTPFARRVADENDSIRHISINIEYEYISEV